ncbi:MAG: class I SAM-dependent methyltransferase [Bacteroidetes bacterium]|nr:class I SAM-dependent methyltransferase [Bacteroidota bacterium]
MEENIFWLNEPEGYTSLETGSWNTMLHPQIAERVNLHNPSTYLDYGCGGAKLDLLLNPSIPVDIYDISSDMLNEAEKNLGSRLHQRYDNKEDIPHNHYEMVVSSLMLMCIDNYEDYKGAIAKMYDCLVPQGQAIIALTHPCFRQYPYSDFQADYTQRSFDYFQEGEAFEVKIQDSKSEIAFTDFHWSLGLTINTMIQCGFVIEEMVEVGDDPKKAGANAHFAPYMMICLRRG